MRLTVRKSDGLREYDVASLKVTTLLAALYEIKAKLDPSLTFDAGCRSGICGACAVRVNGRETLACSHTPADGDLVEPLRYHPVLRDLKVDPLPAHEKIETLLQKEESQSDSHQNHSPFTIHHSPLPPLAPQEEERFRLQSDCILCDSCYSACPVLELNGDFLGPFALTRAWRYLNDPRYGESPERRAESEESGEVSLHQHPVLLERLQKNGIWDCTLCGECTAVCPQGIDPKGDIMQLRGESLKAGYNDPTFAAQSFGTPDFGGGFGFDPNGGFA
jgi:fumarate reductase iron-sulfur subunit